MTSLEPRLGIRSRKAPICINGRTLPLSAEDLAEILPHRGAAAMLDRVTEVEPGVGATGQRLFARSDPVFDGHFPGRPIVPGVLLIESLGQLCGIVLWSRDVSAAHGVAGVDGGESRPARAGLGVLAGVKQFRFYRPVVPGDLVRLEVRLAGLRGELSAFAVAAQVDRESVATGSIQIGFRRDPPAAKG